LNLFQKAIDNKQLLEFSLGKGEYFELDREYGEHSILNSWINQVLPLIKIKGIDLVNDSILEMFNQLLIAKNISLEERNEKLLYHLHVYYYLDHEKRIIAQSLVKLNRAMLDSLNTYLDFLISTKDSKAKAFENGIELIKKRGGLNLNP